MDDHSGSKMKFDKVSAEEFDSVASEVFSPVYSMIAEQILERLAISTGTCIDLGSGPSHLAIALAQRSDLTIFAMDFSQEITLRAAGNIQQSGIAGRVMPVMGDAHHIPARDGSIDLVVSRGSFFFWEDLSGALSEVYRVLKPKGAAYIGGGFGSAGLKAEIFDKMKQRNPDFARDVQRRFGRTSHDDAELALKDAGVRDWDIRVDESGFWIIIKKQ